MAVKATKKAEPKKAARKVAPKKSIKGKGSAEQNKKKKSVVKVVTKKPAAPVKKAAEKKVIEKKAKPVKSIDIKTERKTPMSKKKKQEVTPNSAHAAAPEKKVEQTKVKTTNHIKGYSKKDLEHFRKVILDKRDEIIEQLQNLKEQMLDPTTGEYINENSPYSLHMAEQGTDAMEREKTFLYAQRENKFLGYLEDALKRIDSGTYGICLECIEEPQHLCDTCPLVPKARLEAVPHSQLCLPIKARQEKK
jgi:RNA polymerase-binding transcription factor DksA